MAADDTLTTLARDVLIRGQHNETTKWPLLDLGGVKGRLRLAPGVVLAFRYLRITDWASTPVFLAPAMDWIVPNGPGLPNGPTVWFDNVAIVQSVCAPYPLADAAFDTAIVLPRPPQFPGDQRVGFLSTRPQSECLHTDAPVLQRCWAGQQAIVDVAVFATIIGTNHEPASAGYVVAGRDAIGLCERVMSPACLHDLSHTLDCMAEATKDGGSGGFSSSGGQSRARLVAVLCGALGGLLLLAAGIVVWLAVRRRHSAALCTTTACARANSKLAQGEADARHVCVAVEGLETASMYGLDECIGDSCAGCRSCLADRGTAELAGPRSGGSNAPTFNGTVVGLRPGIHLPVLPLTPSTPMRPGVPMYVAPGEVQLTHTTLGKGSHGRVVLGRYHGQLVAVKMLALPLGVQQHAAAVLPAAIAASPQPARTAADGAVQGPDSGGEQDADCGLGAAGDHARPAPPLLPQEDTGVTCSVKALLGEVEVLARCRHPCVVTLLAANVQPGRLMLVTELMEASLDRVMHLYEERQQRVVAEGDSTDSGQMPLMLVLHIAIEVARALEYLHPTVLHRDLKPSNVLLSRVDSPRPIVKLSDFGCARLLHSIHLVTKSPEVGTAPYMPPEAFDLATQVLTDRVDIYGLAVMLYELLSGRRAWPGMPIVAVAYHVCVRAARPPLARVPDERCPPKLRALLQACWAPDPQRRPAAAEMAKTLALVFEELPTDAV